MKNKTKIELEEFIKLVSEDFMRFRNQFGNEMFQRVMDSGNLPLRKETAEKFKILQKGRKLDLSKFV